MASILSDSTNSDDEQQIAPLIAQAYALLCDQRIPQSIEVYKKCIEQSPKCWRAYQNLGVAYIMAKDYANANSALKIYVRHMSRDPLGHDSLGVSYSQLNDPLQAIASFVNAINLSPGYYMSYYNLGVTLGKLQLHEFALNVYKHCLNIYPNYANAMNNIADIMKKLGHLDRAIEMFKQVIEVDPGYVLGIKNLGNCYFTKKDYMQALLTYLKALEVNPNNDSVLHNLALCLDHFGLYNQAAVCVQDSYECTADKLTPQNIVKPFIAGNLFSKYLHQIYTLFRTLIKLKIPIKKAFQSQFALTFKAVTQCYTLAANLLPGCGQIYENIIYAKKNLIGYYAKLNMVQKIEKTVTQVGGSAWARKVTRFVKWQKVIQGEIIGWRKSTKRLLRKLPRPIKMSQKYYQQQQQVVEMLSNRIIPLMHQLRYKSSTYISRAHNHNLRRLIIKRQKFISKYNRFNKRVNKLFIYKIPLTTLTNVSELAEKEMSQLFSHENDRVEEQMGSH